MTPTQQSAGLVERPSALQPQAASVPTEQADRLAVAEAEIARLKAENNDLKAVPWPRAYVLERASEWRRLLREVNGYLKTCRGSCGSDMAGRDHAIAASDALIAMLTEATTAPETTLGGTEPQSGGVNQK